MEEQAERAWGLGTWCGLVWLLAEMCSASDIVERENGKRVKTLWGEVGMIPDGLCIVRGLWYVRGFEMQFWDSGKWLSTWKKGEKVEKEQILKGLDS